MNRFCYTALAWLLLALPAWGQKVTMPAEVKVPVGRLATIKIEFDGDKAKWDVPTGTDIDSFREYDDDPKTVRLRFVSYKPGSFRIVAVTVKDGKLSDFGFCNIIVGTPPKPPDDPVDPIDPTDPLVQLLQSSFDEDRKLGVGTLKELEYMAAVYENAAKKVVTFQGTTGAFLEALKVAGYDDVPMGRITTFRRKIADELFNKKFPRTDQAFDDTMRKTFADTLTFASTLVKQVK